MARKPAPRRPSYSADANAEPLRNSRPSDDLSQELADLLEEAKHFLDGEIATEAEAEGVTKLLTLGRDLEKRATASKGDESKPFNEGLAEVRTRYKPIETAVTILQSQCKVLLGRWRDKLAAKQAAVAEEVRKAAEEASARAQEAAKAAGNDIGALSIVANAEEDARRLLKAADRTEKQVGKGLRMRTVRTIEIETDEGLKLAIAWLYRSYRDEVREWVEERVQAKVSKNFSIKEIPGVTITETKEAF